MAEDRGCSGDRTKYFRGWSWAALDTQRDRWRETSLERDLECFLNIRHSATAAERKVVVLVAAVVDFADLAAAAAAAVVVVLAAAVDAEAAEE